jgi:cytochrome c oxidase assembly factor CtaG
MEQVTLADLFTRWDIPPIVTAELILSLLIYLTGWLRLRRTRRAAISPWRMACFVAGIAALFVAVSSPLDTFSESLLFMHMGQHFVLMSIAPPLIVLGCPVVPVLRGLPRWFIRNFLSFFFRRPIFHRIARKLVDLRFSWLAMNLAYICWHIPAAYEFALSSENWHNFEHLCFLSTSLLFWWPILRPWPFHSTGSRWPVIPYLLLADLVNTGLSAFLCFSGRLLYPSYGEVMPRPFGLSALSDQIAAGAFMWVAGSTIFLIPALLLTMQLLQGPRLAPVEDISAMRSRP